MFKKNSKNNIRKIFASGIVFIFFLLSFSFYVNTARASLTVTSPTTIIGDTSVEIDGQISNGGAAGPLPTFHLKYWKNSSPSQNTVIDFTAQSSGIFQEDITGLTSGTAYSYEIRDDNSAFYSSSFTTSGTAKAITGAAFTSGADADTAKVAGTATGMTTVYLSCWTTANPTPVDSSGDVDSTSGAFSINVSNPNPGTAVLVSCKAENYDKTVSSGVLTYNFTVPPPGISGLAAVQADSTSEDITGTATSAVSPLNISYGIDHCPAGCTQNTSVNLSSGNAHFTSQLGISVASTTTFYYTVSDSSSPPVTSGEQSFVFTVDNSNNGNNGNNGNGGGTYSYQGMNYPSFVHAAGSLVFCDGGLGSDGPGKPGKQLCGFAEFMKLLNLIIHNMVFIYAPIIATITFAYAGFLVLTSGSNAGKREEAKGLAMNVVIGLAIAMGAWILVKFVLETVGYGSGFPKFY